MLIFIIFGIFFFPRINAEKCKIETINIYQNTIQRQIQTDRNNSIHWKRCVKSENTEMEYLIDSPMTKSIGRLVKETKIYGCQDLIGGCNLILRFGDGRIFYNETIERDLPKIDIDLGTVNGHKTMFLDEIFNEGCPKQMGVNKCGGKILLSCDLVDMFSVYLPQPKLEKFCILIIRLMTAV